MAFYFDYRYMTVQKHKKKKKKKKKIKSVIVYSAEPMLAISNTWYCIKEEN
jgi:hypothetical protein